MLSKNVAILFLISVVHCAAGCGGPMTPAGGMGSPDAGGTGTNLSAGNVAACQSYVQTFNSLSCVPASSRVDAATLCPSSLNANGCNAVPYFDCVRSAIKCKTISGISVVDTTGIQNCVNLYPCH